MAPADQFRGDRRRQPGVAANGVLRRRVPGARSFELRDSDRSDLRLLLSAHRARDDGAGTGTGTRAGPDSQSARGLHHRHPRQHRRHRRVRCLLVPRAAADLVVRDGDGRFCVVPRARRPAARRCADARPGARAAVVGRAAEHPRRRPAAAMVSVLPHRLSPVRAPHQRQPDRSSANAAARGVVPRLRAAPPAEPRCRARAVRPGDDHRRRLGQRRQPRARLGRRARRCGRDRSRHPADRQARSSGSPVRRSAGLRASQRWAQLPEVGQQAVRPDRLRTGRFAGAAQRLQQHPPRKLPVHQAGHGRRAQAPAARRRIRHVQLFPPGLDRVAAAKFRARRVRQRRARHQSAKPGSTQSGRQPRRRLHHADRRRQHGDSRRVRAAAGILAAAARAVRSPHAEWFHRPDPGPERRLECDAGRGAREERVAAVPIDEGECRCRRHAARHR